MVAEEEPVMAKRKGRNAPAQIYRPPAARTATAPLSSNTLALERQKQTYFDSLRRYQQQLDVGSSGGFQNTQELLHCREAENQARTSSAVPPRDWPGKSFDTPPCSSKPPRSRRPDQQLYVPRGRRGDDPNSRASSPTNSICSVVSEFSGRRRYDHQAGCNPRMPYYEGGGHPSFNGRPITPGARGDGSKSFAPETLQLIERCINSRGHESPTTGNVPFKGRSPQKQHPVHSKENLSEPRKGRRSRPRRHQGRSRDSSVESAIECRALSGSCERLTGSATYPKTRSYSRRNPRVKEGLMDDGLARKLQFASEDDNVMRRIAINPQPTKERQSEETVLSPIRTVDISEKPYSTGLSSTQDDKPLPNAESVEGETELEVSNLRDESENCFQSVVEEIDKMNCQLQYVAENVNEQLQHVTESVNEVSIKKGLEINNESHTKDPVDDDLTDDFVDCISTYDTDPSNIIFDEEKSLPVSQNKEFESVVSVEASTLVQSEESQETVLSPARMEAIEEKLCSTGLSSTQDDKPLPNAERVELGVSEFNQTSEIPTEKVEQKEESIDWAEEVDEDSWDAMYDDGGHCTLSPSGKVELYDAVGKVSLRKPKQEYHDFKDDHDHRYSEDDFQSAEGKEWMDRMVEMYDFPANFQTQDLLTVLKPLGVCDLKWVDDTHAIAAFSTRLLACECLSLSHPLVKTRPLSQGLAASRQRAMRLMELPSSRPRPETSATMARRLVATALGLKVRVPQDRKDSEMRKLKNAKEQKKLNAKQREDAWEGNFQTTAPQ